ncbi:MAG: DNA polymerase IV [Thermoleophilia bacterium]|nr:DNA polymerase IV [Thermoleophilia bacterium]
MEVGSNTAAGSGSHGRRVIAHVDADAFYATVHLIEDPTLRGKPVIVAGDGPRSIVTTASYEARRFGIGSAMPAATARRLCPHAVFLRPNFDLYRDYSRRAMKLVRQVTDVVEPLSLDEAYLDVTDVDRPIAAMRALVERIRAETGLTYSVGIGPNKLCAKVLSDYRKPSAFNVASREQCCELFADASPGLINGIGPKTVAQLAALEITTIEQLRDADRALLVVHVGERRADELQARARFEHGGCVQPSRERKSMSEERTFPHDIDDPVELADRLRTMAYELSSTLERRELRGRTIGIKVRLADFTTVTRARTLDARVNDARTVAQVADELLRDYAPSEPVRLLGVRVAGFDEPARSSSSILESNQLALDLA